MEEEIDNLNFAEDEENEEDNVGYDPTDPTGASNPKKKKKKKIVLSETEQQKIKKTIDEMKINQVQPQKSGGRVFKGPGFVSNPPKIIYKDFEVGKKMSLTVDITNISYSFNSFHLQPLDDDIIDFFEIDYRPCGRIPAGISTKMTLHFTPLVNKDYKSYLRLLSETGLCEIPIECYCKKCLISFEKETIDYGEVILGQEIIKQLVVSNNGALGCKYTMVDVNKNLLQNPDEDDDALFEMNRELENRELDISFDYGWGWLHANLPREEEIESDHVDIEGRDVYFSIDKLVLNAPDLADAVNSGYESTFDQGEDSEEDSEQ